MIPADLYANPIEQPKVRRLFAEFGVRLAAFGLDLLLVVLIVNVIDVHVLTSVWLSPGIKGLVAAIVVFVYFALSWAGPPRATPAQLLTGMRVVSLEGETLGFGRAALRSLALAGLFAGFLAVLRAPESSLQAVLLLVCCGGVLLGAVTPNRQSVHDLLAGTVVVNRKTLAAETARAQLLEHLADRQTATRAARRPSIGSMLGNGIGFALIVFVLFSGVQVARHKSLYARTAYALAQIDWLRTEVALFHVASGRWPASAAELGVEHRFRYPAGGYYQLERDGAIRIQFEKTPELRDGSFLFQPDVRDGEISWKCEIVGDIQPRHAPRLCT